MPRGDLFLGVDVGTSGVRAMVIDAAGAEVAQGAAAMAGALRDPEGWWQAARTAIGAALAQVDRQAVRAVAVDGTSGTLLAVDARGVPLAPASMYNDACREPAILAAIDAQAPAVSAARGPTSGLARALRFQALRPHRVLHQADWIAFRLSGRMVSDANNALKTGYDAEDAAWGGWIAATGLDNGLLPDVVAPGTPVGPVTAGLGLPRAQVVAGTTDGCASFLATGASRAGDGVSVLGTTLTLKVLSDRPIFAPEFGIYSHRLLGLWLAGGASNSGGAALLAHFTPDEMAGLSAGIDPETDSGLDYYPLPGVGERFPLADPAMEPRLTPRPANPARFLQGLLEGIAAIEVQGYARLAALGAPPLRAVRSLGGGAGNAVWARIRARRLGVPLLPPVSDAAAYGAALLARRGVA